MNLIFKFLIFAFLVSAPASFAQSNLAPLAKIGAQTITANDLSQEAQTAQAQLPATIGQLRDQILAREIAAQLFAAEASARKITVENLLDSEVKRKAPEPTAARVQAVYDANLESFGGSPLAQVRPQIVAYLKNEIQEELVNRLADELRAKYKVVPGVDINSANVKPTDVAASFGATKILAQTVLERARPLEYNLRLQVYEKQKTDLDAAVYSALILRRAEQMKAQPEDVIKTEISDKFRQPDEAAALKFYNERKAQFTGASFENLKTQILTFLGESERTRLEQNLRERLSKQFAVQILLKEPIALTVKINTAGAPAKGAATAPVTIVMFTDFQCSACARVHPVLAQVLKTNAAKTRFVVRNYPLENTHERAFRAAQAAQAANAQNKFFEYIEFLYQNQNSLDDASLKKYAVQIGLNPKQFETDLNGGKFDAAIRRDQAEGDQLGVRATPTIFVNGVVVNDLSGEGLQKAIEKQLVKK